MKYTKEYLESLPDHEFKALKKDIMNDSTELMRVGGREVPSEIRDVISMFIQEEKRRRKESGAFDNAIDKFTHKWVK